MTRSAAGATLGDMLGIAGATLRDAGIAEARNEAIRLWAEPARETPASTVLRSARVVPAVDAEPYFKRVMRRAAGEPLPYVTGSCGFRRLTLRCDRRALIPRPETEGLVEAALARVRTGVAADIGTGTGAVALALRDEGAFDAVFAVELSSAAGELAGENLAACGLAVTLLAGDLVAPLAGRQVDLLVSNPPYLTRAEHDSLDPSVRDYEPAIALVAGEDGLSVTRRLLDEGRAVVAPRGWIALEVDYRRAAETGRIASGFGWQEVSVHDDLFGRARYVLARRGSRDD